MEFYTSFGQKRPVRLCEKTRQFAYESLYEKKYGADTKATPSVEMDGISGFEDMTDIDKYDAMIYEIAAKAPIRICENERISGAATLGLAISHRVPATYKGEAIFESISHLTVGFSKVLDIGINGIRRNAEEAYRLHTEPRKRRFLESCIHCLDCFEIWHKRYIDALRSKVGYEDNLNNLLQVPMNPPRNFYEAVQSLWFTFAFTRLCGNWSGIGRIDNMLGGFLKHDLEKGELTLEDAREILAHFFIKGCEWIVGDFRGSGDAQHYQNLLLAGIDENGIECENEVTYLVLDIIEELGISDFPTTVRINKNTSDKLIRRVADVMRYGNGVLAVYNEDTVLSSLLAFGYPESEARQFTNDGCWEVQIPGKTRFSYYPFDSLAILQHITFKDYSAEADFGSYDELYSAYIDDLRKAVNGIYSDSLWVFEPKADGEDWKWRSLTPCTVVSLFEEDCFKNGASYLEGGPKYAVISPHIGGIADTANSLYIMKKLVFDEKKIGLKEFTEILRKDWEGNEALRQYILNNYKLYGNDNDEVDNIVAGILDEFADACKAVCNKCPIKFPAGVSTFGRQIEWAPYRTASPHGRHKGEVLAGNLSPTPSTALLGATAVIRSHCKADLTKQTTGAALDIRLLPSDVKGENGITAIASLIKGFVSLGGYFMQIDVADAEILRDAQNNPQNYPALSVRVSGWNARFVTLSEEWQNMVIDNIEGGL